MQPHMRVMVLVRGWLVETTCHVVYTKMLTRRTYHDLSGAEDVACHPGGPEKQMLDLGVACADLSGGATDDCAGACRASWDANYTKCLEPFWQFIPAPFRPPFDRVKEVCLTATAQATAGAFRSCACRDVRHMLLLRSS